MKTTTEKIIFKALDDEGLLEDLKKVFKKFKGHEIALVGGALRDVLNSDDEKVFDLDFATSLKPEETLKVLESEKVLQTGIKFGTVTWVFNSKNFEITTYRVFEEYSNHRQPNNLSFGTSKDEDLKRRDFTVNAMMLVKDKDEKIYFFDPLQGLEDLENKNLRAIGSPEERFNEDAIRVLRLYRLYLTKNFIIEDKTFKASIESFELLKHVSSQRLLAEVEKTFEKPVYLKKLKNLWSVYTGLEFDELLFRSSAEGLEDEKVWVNESLWIYFLFVAVENGRVENLLVKNKHKKIFTLYKSLAETLKTEEALKLFLLFSESQKDIEARKLWHIVKTIKPELLGGLKFDESYQIQKTYLNEIEDKKNSYEYKELGEEILKSKVKYAFSKPP